MWLDEIKTHFVQDRIRETTWEQREYAYDLHLIEALMSGTRLGWAFHISGSPTRLYTAHPAEAECIRLELKEGRYVDRETFHLKRMDFAADWEARRRADAEKAVADEQAKQRLQDEQRLADLRREREAWLLLGGQA